MIKRVVLTTLMLALGGNVMSAQAQVFQPNNNTNRTNFRNNFQDYLNNLQTEARRFRDSVKRDVDRSGSFNNSRRQERIKQEADDFKEQVDKLRDRYREDKPIRDNIAIISRYRESFDRLIQNNTYVGSDSRQDWNNLRPDLLRLERIVQGTGAYNQNNGGYNQNNNGGYNQNNNGGFYQNNGTYNPNYRW